MGRQMYEAIPYNVSASGRVVTGRGRFACVLLTAGETTHATLEVWDAGNQKIMPIFRAVSNTTDGIQFANPLQIKNGVSANIAGTSAVGTIYFASSPGN